MLLMQRSIFSEAPKISWCNISVTVVAGETATLHCHVSGKPWPRVLWAKSDGTKPYLEPRQNNLFLLKDAEVRDSGLYSCIASNNIGQKTVCNTSLIVIGRLHQCNGCWTLLDLRNIAHKITGQFEIPLLMMLTLQLIHLLSGSRRCGHWPGPDWR